MNRLKKRFFSGEAMEVLRISNYRNFLAFRFFVTMAILMQSVTVGWHLYSLTGDVLDLGLLGLTEVIPQVSVSLFAGHFADIWDRKKIIMNTSLLLLLGAAILVLYSIPYFEAYTRFGTFPIFATFFLTGLVRGILTPSQTALIGQLVPRKMLTSAATWSSTNWQVAAVLGPAVGGLVFGFFGIVPAYSLVFLTFLVAVFMIRKVQSQGRINKDLKKEKFYLRIVDGIRYVFDHQVLLGAFSLDMFAVLFGGAVAVLPVFASDILMVGPEGLGILRACPAIGAITMSLYLALNPPFRNTGKYLFYSVAGFGISMIVFALSRNFYLSAIFLVASGAFDNVSVVIRGSILQLFTPEEMKGRVAAVNSIFIGSSNELGAFESGVAARLLGLVPSVVFGGAMTLITMIMIRSRTPRLRALQLIEA